jgi:hypothetical protein
VTGALAGSAGRDGQDVDALVTDRYLDSILAAHARGADAGPTPSADLPDALVRYGAGRLARDLPRFHPSFRFEEALSAKLGTVAARMRLPLAAGGETVPLPMPARIGIRGLPSDDDRLGLPPESWPPVGRPLLIGGLTSAALSIAGAAYVAWRIRRAPRSPMARAVRAVARTRLT